MGHTFVDGSVVLCEKFEWFEVFKLSFDNDLSVGDNLHNLRLTDILGQDDGVSNMKLLSEIGVDTSDSQRITFPI